MKFYVNKLGQCKLTLKIGAYFMVIDIIVLFFFLKKIIICGYSFRNLLPNSNWYTQYSF